MIPENPDNSIDLLEGVASDEEKIADNRNLYQTCWDWFSFCFTVMMSMADVLTDILFLLYIWDNEEVDVGYKVALIAFMILPLIFTFVFSILFTKIDDPNIGCCPNIWMVPLHFLLISTRLAFIPMPVIINRVMRGSVIGSTPVCASDMKNGITDPREPITLP